MSLLFYDNTRKNMRIYYHYVTYNENKFVYAPSIMKQKRIY